MIAGLFWAAEFTLEALGAYFAFRRKIVPLGGYLAFRAFADVVTFAFLLFSGQSTALWADFWMRTTAYVLFWALSMFTVAQILRENKHTTAFYMGMAGLFGGLAVLYFHAQPLTMHRIWGFEMWADMIAAALVCVAMGVQEHSGRTIPALLTSISIGIFIHGASDGLLCAAQYIGKDVTSLYPIGALLALGVWIRGVTRPAVLEVFRLDSLGSPKAEPLIFDEPMNGTMN